MEPQRARVTPEGNPRPHWLARGAWVTSDEKFWGNGEPPLQREAPVTTPVSRF